MKKNPEVEVILKNWLREHGYEGLYHSDSFCACRLEDLIPCDGPNMDCQVGYLDPCDCPDGHDFHIGPKEEKP